MKYKVGDKVRVREWDDMEKEFGLSGREIPCSGRFVFGMKPLCGKVLEVKEARSEHYKLIGGGGWSFSDDMLLPASKLKVVITVDGNATLARLYENDKVVKSAEAKCCPTDEFDFNVGAKLAFDRLFKDVKVSEDSKSIFVPHLVDKNGNNYGTIGEEADFKALFGEELHVGDIVEIYATDTNRYYGKNYIAYTDKYGYFVMGLSILEFENGVSSDSWQIRKVGSYTELHNNEKINSLFAKLKED